MAHRVFVGFVLSVFAALASPSSIVADDNSVSAGDNIVTLPEESADDEALAKEAASTSRPLNAAGDAPLLPPSSDSVGAGSLTSAGGSSTYSGNDTGIAISTVTAEISNNDFHN